MLDKDMRRAGRIPLWTRVSMVIGGLFFSLLLLEVSLRICGFLALSVREAKNIYALRQKENYRIMCIGESTTALHGDDCYPSQLQEILNLKKGSLPGFSVINKGIPATTTTKILDQLEANLNRYDPDVVIAMIGINDAGDMLPYGVDSPRKRKRFLASLSTYKLFRIMQGKYIEMAGGRVPYRGYLDLSRDYAGHDMYERASKVLRKAIFAAPERPEAYNFLGLLYHNRLGDINKAESLFRESISVAPHKDMAYSYLGGCLWSQDRFDEAVDAYKKAISVNPRNSFHYMQQAAMYNNYDSTESAAMVFKELAEIDPHADRALSFLSRYYRMIGEYKKADIFEAKAEGFRLRFYKIETRHNYREIRRTLKKRGVPLVCVQYPMRSLEPLKRMLEPYNDTIFIDNEKIFKEAVDEKGYETYFTDSFAGDFGHCTRDGNRILADNIAETVLKHVSGGIGTEI